MPDDAGLARLTESEIDELALHALWHSLAGDPKARTLLNEVQEEDRQRGIEAFQRARLVVCRAVIDACEHIERSTLFARARKLRALLRIIVESTLESGEPIKQELLGRRFYDKDDFDRAALATEVRRLRKRLDQYYQAADVDDAIRFQIPRGQYVAIVRHLVSADVPAFLKTGSHERARPEVRPLNALRGFSAFPTFSPNGQNVCFSWNRDRGGYNFNLFVQAIGSATPISITSTASAADISPAWSPDGREIGFLRVSLSGSELRIASANPPHIERKVANVFPVRHQILSRQLAWSPDGSALAVVDKEHNDEPFAIWLVSPATGERRRLTRPPAGIVGDTDPAFSQDGKAVAFARAEAVGVQDLFLLPGAAPEPIRLTRDGARLFGLCWLGDSGRLAFSSDRRGAPALWQVGLGGEPPTRLLTGGDGAMHPACSSDGRTLAYANVAASTSMWKISLAGVARDDGVPEQFIYSTRNDVGPHFSPDGSQLAFASDRSGSFEIWICRSNGSDLVKVTFFDSPGGAGCPKWSPDAKRIAFDCRAEGNGHVYVLELKSGRVERLTAGPSENVVPSWSADGRFLYFSSNRTGRHEIWKMPSAGGDPVQVTRSGGFGPAESPDGGFVYYARSRTALGLWRLPVGGSHEELAVPDLKPTFWGLWALTVDGIYFLDSHPAGPPPCLLKFFDLHSGSIALLARLAAVKRVHYQGLAVSPDGQHLVYSQLQETFGEIRLSDAY